MSPSRPAWWPGGRTQQNAFLNSPLTTPSTAAMAAPAARRAALSEPCEKDVSESIWDMSGGGGVRLPASPQLPSPLRSAMASSMASIVPRASCGGTAAGAAGAAAAAFCTARPRARLEGRGGGAGMDASACPWRAVARMGDDRAPRTPATAAGPSAGAWLRHASLAATAAPGFALLSTAAPSPGPGLASDPVLLPLMNL